MSFVLQTHALLLLTACVASVPHWDLKSENECGISDYEFGQRIYGGKDVPPKKWPWLVAIEQSGFEICTGSIISKRFILTAAHCEINPWTHQPFPTSDITIRVGSVYIRKAKQIRLRAFYSHPNFHNYEPFHEPYITNDIAVLELEEEIDFDSNARPICLGKDFVERNGTLAVIAGWGKKLQYNETAQQLQEGTAKFVEYEPCKKAYSKPPESPHEPRPKVIKEQHVCALGTNYSDVATSNDGDDGGPIFSKSVKHTDSKVRWVQHGICSFSNYHSDHDFDLPAVFTRLTIFCDWIKETTKGEAECVAF